MSALRSLSTLPCAWLLAVALNAQAQGQAMSDEAMSQVSGQGFFTLTNTSEGGLDFSRITLNADMQLNANLTGMRLGEYNRALRQGTGADIDISALQFGRTDGTTAQRTVAITNPYIEFVYANAADASKREVVGMRMGFGGIQGDIGLKMNAVSGSLLIDAGSQGTIDSRNDTLGGVRWDGSTCTNSAACQVALAQVGGVTAGNASGASRDFFISVLKQAVNFPTTQAGLAASDTAQAGLWLNWRDRLTAINTTGTVPVNKAVK